jgi:hypothetical protein
MNRYARSHTRPFWKREASNELAMAICILIVAVIFTVLK